MIKDNRKDIDKLEGGPLNTASWALHKEYVRIVGSIEPIVFNYMKSIAAAAITTYIEEVANDDTKE